MFNRKIITVLIVSFVITAPLWVRVAAELLTAAQQTMDANAQPVAQPALTAPPPGAPCGSIGVACSPGPTIHVNSGGFTNIGKIFGDIFGPWVDSAIQSVVVAGVGWLLMQLKSRFGISVDESHRQALIIWATNQATSLLADGKVKMIGTQIVVDSHALEAAAVSASISIPDAVSHFDLDGPKGIEPLKAKIIDTIPQTRAGAAIVSQAHASGGAQLSPA